MDKGVNFFEFSDPSESMQGVIKLEQEKPRSIPIASAPSAAAPAESSLDKYRSFCDVDTETVLFRLKKTLWPFNRSKFLESKADLYGAFWVPTTLIFLLSVSGNLASTVSETGGYAFNPAAIVTLAGVIYFFVFSVPAVLSFCILAGLEITYVELTSLYGYSYFIFWPAAIVGALRLPLAQWLAFGLASVWAGVLLTKNYYSEIEALEGFKKYLAIGVSLSGYIALTLTANLYLYK